MKKSRGSIYKQDKINANSSLGIIIQNIADNKKVLDVGCACGDLGDSLKKKKECRLWGMEYNEESINIAMKTGAYEDIFHVDLNNFNFNEFESFFNSFDYIVFGDVLEHILNPQEILDIFKKFLKDDGYFLLSIPNIAHASIKANLLVDNFMYTPYGLLDETHIKFFTRKTIPTFLTNINLEIEKTQYTILHKIGFQKENPYKELEDCAQKIIFSNPYSYVCQYVMKVKKAHIEKHNLMKINYSRVNTFEIDTPQAILNIQHSDINALPKISNHLQEIKQKDQQIQQKDLEIQVQKDAIHRVRLQIQEMETSKFWKLRSDYIRYKNMVKFILLSPRKFCKKYLNI